MIELPEGLGDSPTTVVNRHVIHGVEVSALAAHWGCFFLSSTNGFGERCELGPLDPGRSPGRKRIWCTLKLRESHCKFNWNRCSGFDNYACFSILRVALYFTHSSRRNPCGRMCSFCAAVCYGSSNMVGLWLLLILRQYTLPTDVTSHQNKNNMADSEEQSGLISRFVNVSGVSEERARFYLESASWNLEVCLLWLLSLLA